MLFDLVFEGGGVRGVAFIGALEAFFDEGHAFGRVMGASVGGLTAALLAAGHDMQSLRGQIFNFDTGRLTAADVITPREPFTQQEMDASASRRLLRDIDFPFIPNALEESADALLARRLMNDEHLRPFFSMLEQASIYSDAQWLDWLAGSLNAHAGGEDWASMGLAEFYRRTGRSLTIIASDITAATMLVLNYSTAPELPLKWAVRMTTSVPFLFPPVDWRSEWGMYRGRRVEGHVIVDGAVLSQFPIELFLSSSPEIEAIMGQRDAGDNVLGFLLDETQAVPGVSTAETPLAQRLGKIPGLAFGSMLLRTLLASSSTLQTSPVATHVIRLPVMGIDPYGFAVEREKLIPVINQAYNATRDFLSGWQADPRSLLTQFEKQYVQVVAEKFVVSGDYYRIGDIVDSTGIAIGKDATADVDLINQDPPASSAKIS